MSVRDILQAAAGVGGGEPPLFLYRWGSNGDGQLGDNTRISRSSPVQVGTDEWKEVTSGGNFSFGIKTNGTLWSWGNNTQGRLGINADPFTTFRSSPTQIGALTTWYKVSAGGGRGYAIKTDGTLWAWGSAGDGALGDNNNSINRSSPVQIGALSDWAQVSGGDDFCMAIKTDGTLWGWGNAGRIGDNTTIAKSSPVQIGALSNWAQIASGGASCYAIKTDGTLWAWGSGSVGRLGDNTIENKSSPVQIGALSDWAQVGAGQANGYAVKTNGTLWAWGASTSGALGNDTTTGSNRSSPVQIGALSNWAQVNGLFQGAIAVKTDGTLWGWGANSNGDLALNDTVNRSSPVQIGALTNWQKPLNETYNSNTPGALSD